MKYLLLTIFVIIVGCSAANNSSDSREKLYGEKCGGCHRIYTPSEYGSEKWNDIFPKMSKRAKLSPEENALIFSYIKEFGSR